MRRRRLVGPKRGVTEGRLRFLRIVLPILLVSTVGRAFQLQVLDRGELREKARRQGKAVERVLPRRGSIIDACGQPLALSVPVPSVFAMRNEVTDPAGTARALAAVLGEDAAVLEQRLRGTGFAWLQRKVQPQQAEAVERMSLRGVGIQDEVRRYYPGLELAAAVLGFVGTDGGLEGLESSMEEQLRGDSRERVLARDGTGAAFAPDGTVDLEPTVGSTLHLTLDSSVQYFVEKALADGCRAMGAEAGAAVVLESRTGRILAMASHPGFNPNEFERYDRERYRNRALNFLYEPGSTFKLVTAAAALEEGLYEEDDAFFCENGRMRVADRVIRDHEPHGWLTLAGIVRVSSNIGAAKVGMALGRERLGEYARAFGLGERAGVLLPGESRGLLRDPATWTVVDTANVSFGQGLSVSALQMAAAVNVVATGGELMESILVERITGPSGETVMQKRPRALRRVVSPETARTLTRMMELVVTREGSGFKAAIPGYSVAGKTGTAQKFLPEEGAYSRDLYVASFAGFAPAADPVVTAIVIVDEPRKDTYGGTVAAPIWSEAVGQTLKYLRVPCDRPQEEPEEGPGEPPLRTARDGTEERAARARSARAVEAANPMPDLTGLTLREALARMSAFGCEVVTEGSGVVVSQVPEPGEERAPLVRIQLEPRVGT